MRTVPYKAALEWLARRMLGNVLALGDADAAAYADHFNTAVRAGWEFAFWPEWTVVEQRYFRAVWDAATSFVAGAEVYYDDGAGSTGYWRAKGSSTNVAPGSDATKWAACGVGTEPALRAYVSLDQAGQTAIGEVDAVFSGDPRLAGQVARKVEYQLGADGIEFPSPSGSSTTTGSFAVPNIVWVRFRKRPPTFTSTVWASGTYAAGSRVYYATTGECYLALTSTSATPGSDETKWQTIPFPYVIAEGVKLLAYAEALADDGQQDKTDVVINKGQEQLAIEWLKVAPAGQSALRI